MNGHYSQERIYVTNAYPGKNWTKKVMEMSDEQVHEVYVSIRFRRQNEAKQEALRKQRKEADHAVC